MRRNFFLICAFALVQACTSQQAHRKIASESVPDVVIGKGEKDVVNELKPYPLAQDNEKRTIIYLPQRKDCYSGYESFCEVEILTGKTALADCNSSWFGGKIKQDVVEGWGYNFYQVEVSPYHMSTRMGCFEDPKEKFIFGPSLKVRYNPRLPIVIYSATDISIKYRVWKAEAITP